MTDLETTLLTRIANLLKNAGDEGVCKGCGFKIRWVKHANGKNTPYDAEGELIGTNHFVTCPEREQFRRREIAKAATILPRETR